MTFDQYRPLQMTMSVPFKLSQSCTDVEKVHDSFADDIDRFSFSGMNVKAKLLEIVDGDVFDVLIFVSLSQQQPNLGFFTRVRCKIAGVHCGGRWASDTVPVLQSVLPKFFNCTFRHQDDTGEYLVDITFIDNGKSLKEVLMNHVHPTLGKIFTATAYA